MPIRLKGLHFINTVPFMDKILALMRPFMRKELMDVMELHTTVESFKKYVFLEQLPNEYGGKAGTFDQLRGNFDVHYVRFFRTKEFAFQKRATITLKTIRSFS